MSLDGIWVFEVAGIYGWERVSTVFLEKGRYLAHLWGFETTTLCKSTRYDFLVGCYGTTDFFV